jgi:hypothetical protein
MDHCRCVRLIMRAFWGTEVVTDAETLEAAELARQEQWVREGNDECGVVLDRRRGEDQV